MEHWRDFMDKNLKSRKNDDLLARLIDETLRFSVHNAGIRPIKEYSPNYWPSWPYAVVSFLEKGEILARYKDRKGVWRRSAGMATITPPNVVGNIRILSPDGATFIWSHVAFTIMGSVELLDLYEYPIAIDGDVAMEIRELNLAIGRSLAAPGPLTVREVLERRKIGTRLLEIILERAKPRAEKDRLLARYRALAPLNAALVEGYREDWTIERMSRLARMSRAQLHRTFKECHGRSPLAYVADLRCREARRLLLTTDRDIVQIADAVGYEDPFYFSRRFKSVFGLAPAIYRRVGRESGEITP